MRRALLCRRMPASMNVHTQARPKSAAEPAAVVPTILLKAAAVDDGEGVVPKAAELESARRELASLQEQIAAAKAHLDYIQVEIR